MTIRNAQQLHSKSLRNANNHHHHVLTTIPSLPGCERGPGGDHQRVAREDREASLPLPQHTPGAADDCHGV
jgi:hypothetical protein